MRGRDHRDRRDVDEPDGRGRPIGVHSNLGPSAEVRGRHGVRTFVDRTRGTPAHGTEPASSVRSLETVILYPAPGPPGDGAVVGAPPLRVRHRVPLIVRAHGLGGLPKNAIPLMREWAAAGYVVAMPKFPLSNGEASGGPTHDILEQARDLRFVISRVLQLHGRDRALRRIVNAQEIGLSGFSDGAATVLVTAFESCCRDARVRAVVATSGGATPLGIGRYLWTERTPPMLLIRGDADPGYPATVATFAAAHGPRDLVTISGAPHLVYFEPWRTLVVRSELAFLDGWLGHGTSASSALSQIDACSSLVTVRTGR